MKEAFEALEKALVVDPTRVKKLFERIDQATDGYTGAEILESMHVFLKWLVFQTRKDSAKFITVRDFTTVIIRMMAESIEKMTSEKPL